MGAFKRPKNLKDIVVRKTGNSGNIKLYSKYTTSAVNVEYSYG